MTVSSY